MKDIIIVRHLVKNYKTVKAVKDISFTVKEGSLFAFLGENGAGKSTSINVLCTVLSKTSGRVTINGYDLDSQAQEIRNSIGIVFQNSVLDGKLNVKQNLVSRCAYYGMSNKDTKERLSYLEKLLSLTEIMNRKYEALSGGQKRRVDIARALINNPKVLFLDEPTTGLDPKTRKMVWSIINDLRTKMGLTVFLTTHYMEETEDADEVVIIDHGEIVAHDTPNNLKTNYSSNKMLWHVKESKENDALLEKYKLKYIYNLDTYKIKYNKNEEIIDFLSNERKLLTDYELIKGNMDDVFINVTGKELGE